MRYFANNLNIPDLFVNAFNQHKDRKDHPYVLHEDGLICFCGKQGSGKTLSAVQYVNNLAKKCPKAIIVSNIELNLDIENIILPYQGVNQLTTLDNGQDGIIYLIDEIHLEFNSLESKDMPQTIFEMVAQQRKRRVHIVGTAQVFARMAKPFREQFKYAVVCDKILGSMFVQTVYEAVNVAFEDDIRTELHQKARYLYVANEKMFSSYDTLQVIKRINQITKGRK